MYKFLHIRFFAIVCGATLAVLSPIGYVTVHAAPVITQNAPDLVPRVSMRVTPATDTFTEGATFKVPIYINTKGTSISAVDLKLRFDPKVLSVAKPSSGSSVVGMWLESPVYDNKKGIVSMSGAIPGGITTDSGLLVEITFEAKTVGNALVYIDDATQVFLNDGAGGHALYDSNRGQYKVVPMPPAGVLVYSETHPFRDKWYNNPNPSFVWVADPGVQGFSFELDTKPVTVPDNTVDSTSIIKGYENIPDGVWYFHIKAKKNGVRGVTTDFVVHIDTTPPAEFHPVVNYLTASAITNRAILSYFTTDELSGLDRYEVGVIRASQPLSGMPLFVRADPPYQVPLDTDGKSRVIIRAHDKAGNVREQSIDIEASLPVVQLFTDNLVLILLILIGVLVFGIVVHYFLGHHILRHIHTIVRLIFHPEKLDKIERSSSKKKR